MGATKWIPDILNCISDGVNPKTNEIFNRWELVQNPEFQTALQRLQKTYLILKRAVQKEEKEKTVIKQKSLSYPQNLLKKVFPEQNDFPSDVETRIKTILQSRLFAYHQRSGQFIQLYYINGLTLKEIGDVYFLSRERVRQILEQAIKTFQIKRVSAYLLGETEALDPVSALQPATHPHKNSTRALLPANNLPHPSQLTEKSSLPSINSVEQHLSITKLAVRISNSGVKPRVTRKKLTAWLLKSGDISSTKVGNKWENAPTPFGEKHGIKKESGIDHNGRACYFIALDQTAQEYVISHLDEIIKL